MKSLRVDLPKIPERSQTEEVLSALGRLVLAWSATEFDLAMLLSRLMARPDITKINSIDKETGTASVTGIIDANAVFSIYFSIESNRGRRDIVQRLLDARVAEGVVKKEGADQISKLLEELRKLARQRNRYVHTAMGSAEGNPYVFLEERLFVRPEKKQNLKELLGQVKVTANAINDVSDRLVEWRSKFSDAVQNLSIIFSPG